MRLKTVKKLRNKLFKTGCLFFLLLTSLIPVFLNLGVENGQTYEHVHTTLLGHRQDDEVYDMAIGDSGHVYIMGHTNSPEFPTTPGVYDETHNGAFDVFVQKRSEDGITVIWSTLIGGSSDDANVVDKWHGKMVLDENENIIIIGRTLSNDFPVTSSNNYTHGGDWDVFVAKLSSDGTELLWSTFIGGNDIDIGRSVTIDLLGNIYVTGETNSTNFPIKNGIYNRFEGNFDAFIVKLAGADSELLWSTFLGGQGYDIGNDIAIDKFNSLYVVGTTGSDDFPINSAFDDSHDGFYDAYITKFSPDGSDLEFSTFLGGQNKEEAMAITLDPDRNIYVTGTTGSDDFPVSKNAIQSTFEGGQNRNIWTRYGASVSTEFEQWYIGDSFVTKLNASGTGLEWSTYLGGSTGDIGWDIALDNETNVFTLGTTLSDDFPLANNMYDYPPYQRNGYISLISKDGRHLIYSDYLGGTGWDALSSLVVDSKSRSIIFSGWTMSADFPKIEGPPMGGGDGFIAVIKYPPIIYPGGGVSFDLFFILLGISAVVFISIFRRKSRS